MNHVWAQFERLIGILLVSCFGVGAAAAASSSSPAYHAITPTMENESIELTGQGLTVDQIIKVARYGAKVRFSSEILQKVKAQYALRQQAGEENIAVYGLNRGPGALREVVKPVNQPALAVPIWLNGGTLPELEDEDLARAIMLIAVNTSTFATSVPEELQIFVNLLNNRVTPVFYSRGALGEGDLWLLNPLQSVIVGRGDAYYRGVRMKAGDALKKAGIRPQSFEVFFSGGNAFGDALAALFVEDGRKALEWADLIYAMDKLAMNSSVTPMAAAVQAKRHFKWVNWDAARIMDMLRGSYLFDDDPKRILQDPESMRASYIRQGAAWQAWAALKDAVETQINGSETNSLPLVNASPEDSWELSTPQFMKYYVKGGASSEGPHGYILSNANWDPYPLANQVEAFTNALANMDAAVAQRIERFSDRSPTAFFTGIKPADVLTPEQVKASPALSEPYFVFMDIWAEIQNLSRSITPEGNAMDVGVADVEAFTRIKGTRGLQVVDLTMELLSYDLLTATYWMDVRKLQDPSRQYARAPMAVWTEFRREVPWQMDPALRPEVPYGVIAYDFLKKSPASRFYQDGPSMPQ